MGSCLCSVPTDHLWSYCWSSCFCSDFAPFGLTRRFDRDRVLDWGFAYGYAPSLPLGWQSDASWMTLTRLSRWFLDLSRLSPLPCWQCSHWLVSVWYFCNFLWVSSPWVFACFVGFGWPWVPFAFLKVLLAPLSPYRLLIFGGVAVRLHFCYLQC